MFPVRYELNSYILFRRNSVCKVGLNLAAVKHTTVQVSRLPLKQEKLIIGHDLLY
jgi:hypothetical protein